MIISFTILKTKALTFMYEAVLCLSFSKKSKKSIIDVKKILNAPLLFHIDDFHIMNSKRKYTAPSKNKSNQMGK